MVSAVARFPRTHKFLLGDRIQDVAMNVLESLIEGDETMKERRPRRSKRIGGDLCGEQ